MQVSSFNARAALRVRVLPKHLTKRLQHVAAVDSAHGQNGQRVSNAPEPAVVLSELQDVKQQMSQLLQLLMVQQQQNSGLQQKVELLSQQVIMLKEEAGASSASRLPEQHQSLVSTSEKVATRPSSVPDGGDLASKPQVSSPSLAPSPMTKSTSSQAERSSPNYHGLVASDSAMVESKENVNAQNQAVEDEFSNRLDVQLDLMDVLMMVEPEGESDEELRYEAVQEEEEGTAAVLDVNEGVARLEEILSSQTSQGLIRRSPHHDAAPAEMAPEPTPHRAYAHVDEGNTVSEQVNVDVESGKGTALHMVSPAPVLPVSKLVSPAPVLPVSKLVSPAPVLPVSKLVSPAPVLPVSKLAEDPLLQELKHQNEQLVALLKNQGITPPESLIIQSRVPTVNKIKAPEVQEREIEATTAAITDGTADLLGKKYENKVDTTTAGATAGATATAATATAAAAASECSDDPLPSTTVIDPKPAATEPTRVISTTAADLKGASTTATAVMSTQESKLQLHRPLTLPQLSEKSSEQPSSKIVQTTSSQISATVPETELPSMRSAEINLDVVPSQSSALSQPENSLLMVSNLPVTLKKRDQSSEAQTLNADTSVRRDTDRRPEASNRPLSVPQTAVQRRISVAKKWQDIRAIVERQPAGFDALAAAAALNKLSELYPEGLQFINDSASSRRRGSESVEAGRVLEAELAASEAAEQLTTELMSLLQLQLPRLPANYLAEALGAAGKLGASAPRSAWLLSAMGAVQSKMSRMASSELVSSLTGLCALEAHPSDAWMRAVLGETQRRMTGQELSLSQLGRVAAAVAGLESKVRPDPEWLKIMEDSARRALSVQSEEQSIDTSGSDANTQGQTLKRLSSTSSTPQAEVRIKSQQREELVGVISLLSGCQALGLKLDPEWALSVLYSAVSKAAASSTVSNTSDAGRDLMQGCSPAELAGLAAALCDMKAEPSGDLLEGYAQAVWPKLQQLTSHQVMTVFDALVSWSYSFPSTMVASFSARLSEPEALDSMKAGDMVLLLSRLSGLGGPADSLSIDAIQDALLDKGIGQAKSNHRLPPDSLVGILGALAALEASPRVPLLAAITRDLRSQLPSFAPSMFRDFARHCATLSVRVDIDLVESYFEVMLEQLLIATSSSQSAGLSKGSLACVELVCALGLIPSNKPRASLLGPLLGITQEVLPGLPPSQLSALLGAFASLKLTREDTQGVRPTINAGMPVPPTPEDFTASLVTALHLHLPTLPPAQMSVIGVRLASLPTPPPSTWAAAFLTSFQGKLEQAASSAVVQLLAALPGLAPDQSLVPEGWVQACLEKLLSGMESMDLDDMSGVLEAVAASGQNPGPQFLASIARQAQIRLDAVCEAEKKLSAGTTESVIIVNLGEFARLACGMAAVGAAPSSAWLQSLQRATLPRLSYSEVQSQPPSATLLADLSWAVAKLASNSTTNSGSAIHSQQTASSNVTGHSVLAPRFSLAPGFMDKEWMDQLLWCINYRVMSPRGDPFQLQDLAKVLWASAVIGLEPRREVINSFVGKSQDRLSSMSQTLTLHSLWSLSRHRAFMNSKWLNQWSLPVLNVVHTMGPQTYVECVWSLGLQHPEGTPEPSQHLLKQMGACLIRHLQASAVVYPGTGAAEGHAGVPGAAPLVPEQHISSHQLVQVLVVLARLGVGEYAQGLAAASCTALKVRMNVI
ncbi:hypothetical protein CEUSTIGMA_g13604.t1 [Chlamydomonas eustigma]|uniref:Uncharacterized protein n=1 Tax=Chlamydomonas eustigma TaxID=1157962 RepID=A0A250XSW8_9CHLO|nr:hypothetical protein CEUSTIGMA_g13604.t1 [Chlamydomonas eustigma]|eukprot:GAX86191.1 hypothetical protein CEUSTIGMA_g13604.t1 [Chlamydomonas eustigma]